MVERIQDEADWDKYHNSPDHHKIMPPGISHSAYHEALACPRFSEVLERDHLNILVLGTAGEISTSQHLGLWEDIERRGIGTDSFWVVDYSGIPLRHSTYLAKTKSRRDLTFVQANGVHLPFVQDTFDVIVTHFLFDCLSESTSKLILDECERVTRMDGFNLHCVSVEDSKILRFLANRVFGNKARSKLGVNFNTRPSQEYGDWFRDAGFEIMVARADENCVGTVYGVRPRQESGRT